MVANVKDKAAIVGIGNTTFSKNSGVSELSLAVQAVKAALDDAGLHPSEVDGMATFTMDTSDEIEVARALGVGEMTFFGRAHYGAIRGMALPAQVVGQASGPLIAGVLFDASGSYNAALLVFAAIALGSSLLVFAARPPRALT